LEWRDLKKEERRSAESELVPLTEGLSGGLVGLKKEERRSP
jgi:hypothetical protein